MPAAPPASAAPAEERPANRWLGLVGGLLVVAGLGALDAAWGPKGIISATVVMGPFLAALLAPPRLVAVVGAVAVATAAASGTWNENFGDQAYWVRLLVVIAGSGFAVVAAGALTRSAHRSRQFAVLAALAELGDGTDTLEATVDRLCDLLVPAFADVLVVDLVQEGEARRLAVRAHGPRAAEFEDWLGRRPPENPDVDLSSRHAAESGQAQLISRMDPQVISSYAKDPADREMLLALGGRSSITVPLRSRGRTLGALSLSVTNVSGRRYGPRDAEFSQLIAGRAALALDNAGLFAELETTEAQLSAALGALTDGVTVQTAQGRLIYANDAAARLMGFESSREVLSARPEDIFRRYEAFREDGRPLELDEFPGRRVLAGEAPDPLVLRAIDRDTGEETWNVIKATAVRDREGRPLLAVNVIEDITQTRRAEFGQRLLARAGEVLASSLDYEMTLQQIAELAVPELADWCGVSLPDGRGYLRQVAVAHVDPDKVQWGRELSDRYPVRVDEPTGSAQVLRDRVPQRVNDIPPDLLRQAARDEEHYELIERIGMRAAMIVPLEVGGRAIGTLTLVSAESGRTFTEADEALAGELARRAGTAVENARLYTERSNIAATLQAGLLPQPLPEIPGWTTATLYSPAGTENWVGGDFYDAYPLPDGWMIVVGDVAGRGAPAAALTGFIRYTLRTAALLLGSPLEAIGRVNAELHARADGSLCTLACLVLRENGEATVMCAGHPQPFAIRDGHPQQVGSFGPMVGALAEGAWHPEPVPLGPGDTLVLYTDGVIDAEGRSSRFGEDGLARALGGTDGPRDAVARVDRAVQAFQDADQVDDIAVVAIGRPAQP